MDREAYAVAHNAHALAVWAAGAVLETDALIATAAVRPLSPAEQGENLKMQRELLVRISQQGTLIAWATETRKAPWWARWWTLWRGPPTRRA